MNLTDVILPELVLVVIACALFLLGVSSKTTSRRLAARLALFTMLSVIVMQGSFFGGGRADGNAGFAGSGIGTAQGAFETIEVGPFANYVKLITAIIGTLLVLLAWPTNKDATGSRSLDFGRDAGEFYGLMLLAIAGLMLVAGANDLMLLFLGIELASIPTYIMVSMSRPLPAAQEAGVKYFFLGAMAAAIMLFGFSYLYGVTGMTKLSEIRMFFNQHASAAVERQHVFTPWEVLAICMLIAGFAFKIAAVPLHAYVGDVYQGAATPVTAFLAFVPKTTGFVALIKTLIAVGGDDWRVPPQVVDLLWILAILTMTIGNVLGLLQNNIKRVFAYSSIAHSGYMLVGITALVAASDAGLESVARGHLQSKALAAVLFYLAAYGIMNTGAFGVLMLLPSRDRSTLAPLPATSAETFEDIAGIGRSRMGLALAMTVCCFSLIGLPLTVGFFGKLFLIQPALGVGTTKMNWLVAITVANAAIGAAYYLRIIVTMFLRSEPTSAAATIEDRTHAWWASPIGVAVVLSVILTLVFGSVLPVTNRLSGRSLDAARFESTGRMIPGQYEQAAIASEKP